MSLLVGGATFGIPAFLLGSSCAAVLLTPRPNDPWRQHLPPDNGVYRRVSDGAELMVRSWLPVRSPRHVVLGIHGLGQHSGYHAVAGELFAASRVAYHAVDLRGNGLTRTQHGDVPSVARQYQDLTELVEWLRRSFRGIPLFVLGHSLGGGIAACWAAETRPRIDGLIVLAPLMSASVVRVPILNYLKGPAAWLFFRHRAVLELDTSAYDHGRIERLTDLPDVADAIAHDPLHLQAMSMAFALAIRRARDRTVGLAPRIEVPVITMVGSADPASIGARAFHDALTVPGREFREVPGGTHLLLQLRSTPGTVADAVAWMDSITLGTSAV